MSRARRTHGAAHDARPTHQAVSNPRRTRPAVRATLGVVAAASACIVLVACGARSPLADRDYPPPTLTRRGTEIGKCSWYGPGFHGKRTANGEVYDQHGFTAAHRTLPMGTLIEVTDVRTRKSVRVRVNDRGPYVRDRACDLSYGAAKRLGMIGRGVVETEIRVVEPRYGSYPSVSYVVQLGVFRTRRDAERLAGEAGARRVRTYVEAVTRSPTKYRVLVGPYDRRSQAVEAAAALRKRGYRGVVLEEKPRADQPA